MNSTRSVRPLLNRVAPALAVAALSLAAVSAMAQNTEKAPLESLAQLDVRQYMGTWYQVALYPNRFQSQCVADTTANYRALPNGTVEVINRCRNAQGVMEEAVGLARPEGRLADGQLTPAQLRVTFVPTWLRWLPMVWGRYWVVQLPADYRYVVVSEPDREYLWVLSRTPQLSSADDAAIRERLKVQGFDLTRLQTHPQAATAPAR
jgi:apolipoprotein D and lipocalin family protein